MDSIRWKKIEDIFHRALEAPIAHRSNLVRQLSENDSIIYDEVMSLIQCYSTDDGPLETSSSDHLQLALKQTMNLLSDIQQNSVTGRPDPSGPARSPGLDESQLAMLVGSLNPDFEYRGLIGRGGMGVVLRVFDRSLQRLVAIKLIPRGDLDQQYRIRILRESRAIARVQSDHIVRIYDVGEKDHTPYLVMELIHGPSLRNLISSERRLGPESAARIACQIAQGLQSAHDQNLIHRDIKPANILLESQATAGSPWRAKIIDFGLARPAERDEERTLENVVVGTPSYMSPEQLLYPDRVDPRSDIYSLGATLYEMIVGEPPFRGAPHMIVRNIESIEPTSPRTLDDGIPRDLESICLKALSKSPDARYSSARSMADDLKRFLNGEPTVARPISRLARGWRWARRNRKLAGAIAAIVLLLSLGLLGSLIAATLLWRKNAAIAAQKSRVDQTLCERIASADPGSLPVAIEQARDQISDPIRQLEALWKQHSDAQARLNLGCALAALGADYHAFVVQQIPLTETTPGICRTICLALESRRDRSLEEIHRQFAGSSDSNHRVKWSIVALQLGDHSLSEWMLDQMRSPDDRTEWIHAIPHWHGDLSLLIDQLQPQNSPSLTSALCLGVGLIETRAFLPSELQSLERHLQTLATESADGGVRSAADWYLRRSQTPVSLESTPRLGSRGASIGEFESDLHLIHIAAGDFQMGSADPAELYVGRQQHAVRLTRDFWISDREVSRRLFQQFLDDASLPADQKPEDFQDWQPDLVISPTEDHPAQQVRWTDAVLFCNWLSTRHGLTPVYQQHQSVELSDPDSKQEVLIDSWIRDESANGFRLPSEAEFEFATRAGTKTLYSFGDHRHFLEYYGAWSNNRRVACAPCGRLMPNAWGLFDVHGNVWEWTDDWYREYPGDAEVDPRGMVPNIKGRIYRGGGIANYTGDPHSSARGAALPGVRYNNLGFRVARGWRPADAVSEANAGQ